MNVCVSPSLLTFTHSFIHTPAAAADDDDDDAVTFASCILHPGCAVMCGIFCFSFHIVSFIDFICLKAIQQFISVFVVVVVVVVFFCLFWC